MLTSLQIPEAIQLSNNYVPLVYSSDSGSTNNFKYKIDLYNENGNVFNSVFVYPDISHNNIMIYDLSYLFKDLISFDNNWNINKITSCPNNFYKYGWNVTEYISLTSGDTATLAQTDLRNYRMNVINCGNFSGDMSGFQISVSGTSAVYSYSFINTCPEWMQEIWGWSYSGATSNEILFNSLTGYTGVTQLDNPYVTPYFTISYNCGYIYITSSSYNLTFNINEPTSLGVIPVNQYFTLIRGAKQYDETFTYRNYLPRLSYPSAKFLSKWSGNRTYTLNDYGTINALYGTFSGTTTQWNRMVINVGGSRYYISMSGDTCYGMYSLPIGPKNLNNAVSSHYVYVYNEDVLATSDIITSNTTSYTVALYSGTTIVSETININVDNTFHKHTPYQFLWLGDLSSMETFTFTNAIIKSLDIKRTIWKENLYKYKNGSISYTQGDRGYGVKDVSVIENYKLISGWLDDNESSNLMEMLTSKEVYLIKNDKIYPIVIETNKIEEKNIKNNKLFNIEIEFSMGYDKNING